MKTINLAIVAFLVSTSFIAQSQSYSNGTYNSNYGTLKFVTETGQEYPNGGMIYGDYKDNGTIVGTFQNNAKEIEGSFHNGAAEGKFVFFPKGGTDFFKQITGFYGNWGYQTNNKYSTNADHKWDGSKSNSSFPNDLKTNVWSGKWNTSQGYLILQQVGTKIIGKYHTVGNIEATYNPATRKLTGTFTNNGKTGYLEYVFEGNSFSGKWGWTTALTGGGWTGTKFLKTNKAVASASNNTSAPSTTQTTTTQLNSNPVSTETVRYRVALHSMSWWKYVKGTSDLYGFAGVRVYRVTNNNRTEIASFGNKPQNYFNTTEDQTFNTDGTYYFPQIATNQRDFVLNKTDLNNPAVDIEVELWHHIKQKKMGPNEDNGKSRIVYNIEELPLDNNGLVSFGENNKLAVKIHKL